MSSVRATSTAVRSASCPPVERDDPPIDYTVKDYESFRRLMLDRIALVAPEWTERNPADLGVALVELVAYVADYLSYEQDAVATEAYLGTARRRVRSAATRRSSTTRCTTAVTRASSCTCARRGTRRRCRRSHS
jgi:hypothetical protein